MGAALSLDRSFSIYLDLVRFLAALAVVAMHFAQLGIVQAPWAPQLMLLGREAVVAFFVLSGFVIAYTTHERRPSAREYAVARCARLYSVALPILLLAFAAAALLHGVPGVEQSRAYQLLKPYLYIPFHLLFMGEMWTLSETPPLLAPWWSLNYEAWYYVLFGVIFYLRGAARLAVGGLVLAIMGIKLWLLLPVWLSGVLLYHWQVRHAVPRTLARIGWVLSIALLAAYELGDAEALMRQWGRSTWLAHTFALGNADRFLADYVVGVIVCLNFAFARHADLRVLHRIAAPVRSLAAYTFTLYLAHPLVLHTWPLLYRHDPGSVIDWVVAALPVGLATYTLGIVTEHRKETWRAHLERLGRVWTKAGSSS